MARNVYRNRDRAARSYSTCLTQDAFRRWQYTVCRCIAQMLIALTSTCHPETVSDRIFSFCWRSLVQVLVALALFSPWCDASRPLNFCSHSGNLCAFVTRGISKGKRMRQAVAAQIRKPFFRLTYTRLLLFLLGRFLINITIARASQRVSLTVV